MKYSLYILTLPFLTMSCATIMNRSYTDITVHTTAPGKIIYNRDTITTYANKAYLTVRRKKEKLKIVATTDSLARTFEVKPQSSFMYWFNIYCNGGAGMLVDRKNPKRYSYPKNVYINSAETTDKYYNYEPNNKGALDIHLSLPYINFFYLKPEEERPKVNAGFGGLSLGLDYYYSKNQFLSLGLSGVLDFFLPFPAAIDLRGEHEFMSSGYVSLSNNYKIKRFTFGYGLSYARNNWKLRYYDRFDPPPPTREPVKKSHIAFGLVFPTYFQTGEYFNIGIIYRPTFYRPGLTDKFAYEHLISIDFAWKMRL